MHNLFQVALLSGTNNKNLWAPSHKVKNMLCLQAQPSCYCLSRSNSTSYLQEYFQDWCNHILIMDSSHSLQGGSNKVLSWVEVWTWSTLLRVVGYNVRCILILWSWKARSVRTVFLANYTFSISPMTRSSSQPLCYLVWIHWQYLKHLLCHCWNVDSWFVFLNANYKLLVCERLNRLFLMLTFHRQ